MDHDVTAKIGTERLEEPARSAAQPAAGILALQRTPHTAAQIIALQRAAGNRATGLLLRETKTAPGSAPAPIPDKPESTFTIMPEDRKKIEAETNAEVLTAFSAFLDACQSNQTALKAAAKAEAEAFALVLDIATGFLAPAFATFAAERLIGRFAEKATKTIMVNQGTNTVALIAKSDFLKAAFTGVAKVGSDQIKRHATVLFGETDEDLFLEQLKNQFQDGAVSLAGKIPGMSDEELIAVWYAYDPELANVSTYKARLKELLAQFDRYVKPITSSSNQDEGDYYSNYTRVYWINAYGSRRLMLVAGVDDTNMWGTTSTKIFKAWVPDLWKEMAMNRTKARFGAVTDIDGKDIDGHIPDPNR